MSRLTRAFQALRACQLSGDKASEAVLCGALNAHYGLRLRDWQAEFAAAGLEPLPCSDRFDLSDVGEVRP